MSIYLRRSKLPVLIMIWFLSFFSCINNLIAPTTGTIQGQVTNATGDTPITGANVSTTPPTSAVSTDAQGKYTISDVSPGQYTVTASKGGYNPASVAVTVAAGQTTTADMHLGNIVAIPPAPVISNATPDSAGVTVSWNTVNGATSYNLYYAAGTTVTLSSGTKVTGVVSPYLLTGLTNGKQYVFAVSAVNSAGESVLSTIVTATPQGPIPLAPVVSNAVAGDSSATVSWNTVTGATSYNLYYKAGTTVDKATSTRITGVASPKIVTGLANGTQYAFAVSAVNSAGESGLSGCVLVNTPSLPRITISAIGSINAGTYKNVIGKIDADTMITAVSYSITTASGSAASGINVTGPTAPLTSKTMNFTATNPIRINVAASAINGSYKLVISATAGATAEASFDFTVGGGTGTPVTTTTITIGSYANATVGSSVDLDAGTVMLAAAATQSGSGVDIVGTYSPSQSAYRVFNPVYAKNSSNITAFAGWVNPNATQMHKVTGVIFASITTKEQIQPLFNAAQVVDNVSCAAGDVLVVKTDLNAYVLVQITSFDANTSGTANIKSDR
jgi:hypothetical protein